MKVYGWDDTGPYRGEMLAASVPADYPSFGLEVLAGDLGWERAFTSFREARAALLDEMVAAGADADLVDLMRRTKARDVPVEAPFDD